MEGMQLLGWTDTTLSDPIDAAVSNELKTTAIVRRFLPLYPKWYKNTVPADTIIISDGVLTIDQSATNSISEIQAPFTLEKSQIDEEAMAGYVLTGAIRTANLVAQAEDRILLQGKNALTDPFFKKITVKNRPIDDGLMSNPDQSVPVPLLDAAIADEYGNNTARAVARAYAVLQENGHYGPYALVLPTLAYADFITPLNRSAIIPAELMKWIVTTPDMTKVHFYGTGALPADIGILLSFGGNTMDLVMSSEMNAVTLVSAPTGTQYPFIVHEYLALRLKDKSAVVQLKFAQKA